MLKTEFKLDADILEAYQGELKRAPKTVNTFIQKTVVNDLQQTLDREVSRENWYPPPRIQGASFLVTGSNYARVKPVQGQGFEFGTPKSRRWFFASNAGGRGIPTKRTGGLAKAFKLSYDMNSGVLAITDTSGIGQWVYGPQQVRGHFVTGWREPQEQMLRVWERAEDLLIEGWISIVDIRTLI